MTADSIYQIHEERFCITFYYISDQTVSLPLGLKWSFFLCLVMILSLQAKPAREGKSAQLFTTQTILTWFYSPSVPI